MTKRLIILLTFVWCFSALQSQTPTPAPEQSVSILYTNATLHIGDGTKILEGAIGFNNGKINYVGSTRDARKNLYQEVRDIEGKHVYPGFIAPNSTLGLVEIGSVRATRDQREVGQINPHIRSVIAFQTESEIIPTVRTNGVLVGQVTPRGSFVAGQSSVVHFDGWNWEDALYQESDGMHIYWPSLYERDHTGKIISYKTKDNYKLKTDELDRYLERAEAYRQAHDSNIVDLRLESFAKLLNNELTLYIHASDAKQITAAVDFKKKWKIQNLVIVGGQESHLVLNLLKENQIGVMLNRVHSLPRNEYDDVDLPYKLPKILNDSGITWCFENHGDMEQMNSRNLPFYAGTAVAYGLDYESAVKGLTFNTAKLMNVQDKIGSLAIGKMATFFISEGDALDMISNDVSTAFVDGREIDLTNRQINLYNKYKSKYKTNEN